MSHLLQRQSRRSSGLLALPLAVVLLLVFLVFLVPCIIGQRRRLSEARRRLEKQQALRRLFEQNGYSWEAV